MSEDFPVQLAGLRSGSLLAGYRLEAQIGSGGMAVVFRARDERLGRLVALKVLAPALTADAAFRRRFMAESRAAATVDDPHIIPIYEAGEANGVLFIAMRFVPGGDLRGVLEREGPLAPARALAFIAPVASALDAAHGAGLVHRDVKPANILVDARASRPEHVYLSDFGVSKGAVSSVSLTGAGHFVGTPDYSAPEQIQGLAVDGRTDQYALACVTYELLTGLVPFERDQGMAVLFAHLSQPPPSVASQRPDLPYVTDQVIAKALAKTPEKRYESCQDFADALREALRLTPYVPTGWISAPGHLPSNVASPLPGFSSPSAVGKAAARPDPVTAATLDSVRGARLAQPADVPPARAIVTGPGGPDALSDALTVDPARATPFERGIGGTPSDGRRRWLIVTTALAVLLAVIFGGGYIAWRWTQDQYYVAANSKGEVVIYRGINQKIAGVSLSSPYQLTSIELDQTPSNYQPTIKTASGTGSLAQVQRIVDNISSAVKLCQQQYAALAAWQTKDQAYLAEIAVAHKVKKETTGIPKPGPQPPAAGATCPPSEVFAIPASALPPGAS